MSYCKITQVDDLWIGEMKGFIASGKKILLVNCDGKVHAFENRCLHQNVELSQGILKDNIIICSAHYWEFDANTGEGINPNQGCLLSYPVLIQGKDIFVDIDNVINNEQKATK